MISKLPPERVADLLESFLVNDPRGPHSHRKAWGRSLRQCTDFVVRTQQPILMRNMPAKKPDIVLYGDGRPFAIIECKVGAGFTWSETAPRVGEAPQQVEQLAAYGSWLVERGGFLTALILLTQYSDPPEDFYEHPRFACAIRSIRRWSDLCRFLNNPPPSIQWASQAPLSAELIDLLRENGLMISDPQATDFAAARLYMGMHSHLRLTQCVNSASGEIRKFLMKKVKGVKFSKPKAQACYDGENKEAYICDWGWTPSYEIGWGFWFSDESGISSWAKDYEPAWNLPDGAVVYVEFFKEHPSRPRAGKYNNWLFPTKSNSENTIWKLRPFQDFLAGPDSSKSISGWLEATVAEATELIGEMNGRSVAT